MQRFALLIFFSIALLIPGRFVFAADAVDTDGDGLSDYDETHIYHSDPNNRDTDGDTFIDGNEVAHGFSPLSGDKKKMSEVDTDGDGLTDEAEIKLGSDLTVLDTDADGYPDGVEVSHGFNPLKGGRDRSLPRHVEVDLSRQQLTYYLAGVPIGSMPVSTGLRRTATPTGEFRILKKIPVKRYIGPGYDLPNAKWNLEFKRGFYLHGAYWHNQFGIRPMSHGCVNISYKDVPKLYDFLDVGDAVKITGVTPAGALAKK